MSKIIGEGLDAVLVAGGPDAAKRTCNRHDDCDAADAKAKERGSMWGAEHCHDECCEDCFGN